MGEKTDQHLRVSINEAKTSEMGGYPYIDRSQSLLRLPPDWEVKHEAFMQRNRDETAALRLMTKLGEEIKAFMHGELTDEVKAAAMLKELTDLSSAQLELFTTVA